MQIEGGRGEGYWGGCGERRAEYWGRESNRIGQRSLGVLLQRWELVLCGSLSSRGRAKGKDVLCLGLFVFIFDGILLGVGILSIAVNICARGGRAGSPGSGCGLWAACRARWAGRHGRKGGRGRGVEEISRNGGGRRGGWVWEMAYSSADADPRHTSLSLSQPVPDPLPSVFGASSVAASSPPRRCSLRNILCSARAYCGESSASWSPSNATNCARRFGTGDADQVPVQCPRFRSHFGPISRDNLLEISRGPRACWQLPTLSRIQLSSPPTGSAVPTKSGLAGYFLQSTAMSDVLTLSPSSFLALFNLRSLYLITYGWLLGMCECQRISVPS